MEQLLEKYKSRKPEIVFEWHDEETDATGWIVINSLRNGAAGGGTRMRKGLTREEVAKRLNISVRTVQRDWEAARAWMVSAA